MESVGEAGFVQDCSGKYQDAVRVVTKTGNTLAATGVGC